VQQEENTRKASFTRAIVMEKLGGPEVLQLQTRPTLEPGRGQLLVNVITAMRKPFLREPSVAYRCFPVRFCSIAARNAPWAAESFPN
jgi:hypothetical protein